MIDATADTNRKPGTSTKEPTAEIRDLMNQGAKQLERGALADAASFFSKALAQQPEYSDAHHMLGVVTLMQGQTAVAIRHIRRAIALDPGRGEFHQNEGLALRAASEHGPAATAFREACRLEPKNVQARELLAQSLFETNQYREAGEIYLEILDLDPTNRIARHNVVHALKEYPPEPWSTLLEKKLLEILDFDNAELHLLSVFVSHVIKSKHGLTKGRTSFDPLRAAHDPLLLKALNTIYITDTVMERELTSLRRALLQHWQTDKHLDSHHLRLVAAIAVHNHANEHVFFVTNDEISAIYDIGKSLQSMIQDKEYRPEDIATPLLVYGMYNPVHKFAHADLLATHPTENWPPESRYFIQRCLLDIRTEIAAAKAIPSFSEIENDLSRTVRSMYEENPYPRWNTLGHVTPLTLRDILAVSLPGYSPPAFADGRTIQVLIAGCGTGRHAIRAAKEYLNANVLAVDLSRRSLAYAQRMSDKFCVTNIEFLQADLLDLPRLNRKFDIIETIGTLETMDDPDHGWATLRGMLSPGGLMYVGSYSETARRPVIAARNRIAELGLRGTTEDIRNFRQRIIDGELGNHGQMLINNGDFYTMSGCRDFLFHVSERRFLLSEIAMILDDNDLSFIGFSPLKNAMKQIYLTRYPEDKQCRNLEHWVRLEQDNPESFVESMNLSMFYFWCQAR